LAEDQYRCLGSPNEDLTFMLLRRSTFVAGLAEGKRVLDIGCVNHNLSTRQAKYWLHGILRERAAYLVGLDYEEDQVESLRREGFNMLLRKCGYRLVSYHFVAENLPYYKGSVARKTLAHAMWFAQLVAGVFRPCLCKNFITVAEPIAQSGGPGA
jgi:hypothetical protein